MVWWHLFPLCWIENRSSSPVLVLLGDALGQSTEFTRENVTVNLFPPYVTLRKQPMDICIIGSLKKRYKPHFSKEIIALNELPEVMKQARIEAGAVGLLYETNYFPGCSTLHPISMEFYENGYNNKLICKGRCYWFSSWIWLYQATRTGWHGVLAKERLFDKDLEMDKIKKEIDFALNVDNDDAAEMQHFAFMSKSGTIRSRHLLHMCSAV